MTDKQSMIMKGVFLFLCLSLFSCFGSGLDVLTQRYDNHRSSANLEETILTPENVNSESFGLLFSRTVVGQVYAQILYVSNLTIQGETQNVIFVATMANNVYAFNADNPDKFYALWARKLDPSVKISDKTLGRHCGKVYNNIDYEIGILSTPVIDLTTNTMYLITFTTESTDPYVYKHTLYELDIITGFTKKFVKIAASYTGSGVGGTNQTVYWNSTVNSQRTALTLFNGIVYLAAASYCDSGEFHGWILGYRVEDFSLCHIFAVTPNGYDGGIWQSGYGATIDEFGYIYYVSGNGDFDGNLVNGTEWGNTLLKLSPPPNGECGPMTVVDYFTPYNQDGLNLVDEDLGSGGALLIPNTSLIITGGKQSKMYLTTIENLGGYNSSGNNNDNVMQTVLIGIQNPDSSPHYHLDAGHIHCTPVYWRNSEQDWIYVWNEDNCLHAYPMEIYNSSYAQMDASNKLLGSTTIFGMPGGFLTLSANGDKDGILWASHPIGDANPATVPGVLRAYNASNVTTELWNSDLKSSDNVSRGGYYAKYNCPTVVNGKVYLATFAPHPAAINENAVLVYGLFKAHNNSVTTGTSGFSTGQATTMSVTTTTGSTAGTSTSSNLGISFWIIWSALLLAMQLMD